MTYCDVGQIFDRLMTSKMMKPNMSARAIDISIPPATRVESESMLPKINDKTSLSNS